MGSRAALQLNYALPARRGYPDFTIEDSHEGVICGIDEVGRGPLAGCVVAACVIIPIEMRSLSFVPEIRDSKKLSHTKLITLYQAITENFSYAIAEISPQEIDRINILQASLEAMRRAAANVGNYDHALVDGNKAPALTRSCTTVVRGDAKSVSIAAASIVAKVHRDLIMTRLAIEYPHYGWEKNVGYPTAQHLEAITKHGITPHHRRSFAPVRRYIESMQ